MCCTGWSPEAHVYSPPPTPTPSDKERITLSSMYNIKYNMSSIIPVHLINEYLLILRKVALL